MNPNHLHGLDIDGQKNSIREEITDKLKSMTPEQRAEYSARINSALESTDEYRNAKIIAAFKPYPTEPQININDPRIALPEVHDNGEMDFRIGNRVVAPAEIDLIIVPCRAYDPDTKQRLGRGGGYYDRYLTQVQAPKFAVAYSAQAVENLPVEDHDVPVGVIFTEFSTPSE